MHELGITQNIVDIVTRSIPERKRLTRARIELGRLTGFVPESIRFYFEAITQGTALEGAELVIEEIPARMLCGKCGAEFEIEELPGPCPGCGSLWSKPLSGRELLVKSIEVEDAG